MVGGRFEMRFSYCQDSRFKPHAHKLMLAKKETEQYEYAPAIQTFKTDGLVAKCGWSSPKHSQTLHNLMNCIVVRKANLEIPRAWKLPDDSPYDVPGSICSS